MDSGICQTSTASPAEPGGLPFLLAAGQMQQVRRISEVQGATHSFSHMLITFTWRELWLRSTTRQPLRMRSAVATSDCTVMRIDRKSMMEVIHRGRAFPDMFLVREPAFRQVDPQYAQASYGLILRAPALFPMSRFHSSHHS
jgi:hypothetical protein